MNKFVIFQSDMETTPKLQEPQIDDGEFMKELSRLSQKGPNMEFALETLENYKEYKEFFQKVFVNSQEIKTTYVFRASYLGSTRDKPIWREIEILGTQTLEKLAIKIIKEMDWDNDHLHAFSFPPPGEEINSHDYNSYHKFSISIDTGGYADPEHPEYLTNKIRIGNINYKLFPRMYFEFDFGDSHEFTIDLKQKRTLDRNEKVSQFPLLTDQHGVAPVQYPDVEDE